MNAACPARSMSRKACSCDNAACEGLFGRLKKELFYARKWMNTTIDELTTEFQAYVRSYDEARLKIFLGSMTPMENRKSLGIAIQQGQVFYRTSVIPETG
jgi:transposase InsO family protein